jgi:hypothetical protein
VSDLLHWPLALAVAVPLEANPSKSSTVLFASAVPETVKLPSVSMVLLSGLVMSGGGGGVVSTVVFSSTETLLEFWLATARSAKLSAFEFAPITKAGPSPAGRFWAA